MTSQRQDWKRPAVLAAILLVLGVYTFVRGAPERGNVDRLEARLAQYDLAALGYRAAEDFNASLPKSRLPLEVVVSEV